MIKKIIILGSTGSIGQSTLDVIKNNKKFRVLVLTSNNNIKILYKQAVRYRVKNVIIENYNSYIKYKDLFKKKKINLHLGISFLKKIVKKKVDYCINSISGISGLEPTIQSIPLTKNILIANKESIITGWSIIKKKLNQHKTNFIPIDSEHFSIFQLIKNENNKNISRIILTASGGPFLNQNIKKSDDIKIKDVIKHPNWKMGKKISVDSATMMNKVFEFIEAKKIFNLKNDQISILIHPTSYIHAIVFFKGEIIKMLAHNTKMTVPIAYALDAYRKNIKKTYIQNDLKKLNNIKLINPDFVKFPLLNLIKTIPEKDSYFETILVTLNDELVKNYLNSNIKYFYIEKYLLKLIKSPFFKKYYKLKPKNIFDIKNMVNITKKYLNLKLSKYD
tara:strand:+ start:2331 stop:3503 length:1173 start_codon:yes stop_codon:yes gene_type:complete